MNEDENECNVSATTSERRVADREARRKTIVAPWKTMLEFKTVYSWIYGERATGESKKCACRQMTIWKIRRQNFTPAAVLGTLAILEVQLRDSSCGPSPDLDVLSDLQIFYSSAFTRFFNYMSSIMQSNNMKTMYETAKELNLRSFVVDLRHLCAHGHSLPSIEILRSTSSYCLKWLEDFYWKGQIECMQDLDVADIKQKHRTEFEDHIIQLFQFYDIMLMSVLSGENKISHKYAKGDYYALQKYASEKNTIDPKHLIADVTRDLSIIVKQEQYMNNLSITFVDAILKMKYFFDIVKQPVQDTDFQEDIVKSTQGLFRMLAIYGLIEDLFFGLLAVVENKNEEPERRLATGFWANQIVLGFFAFRQCKEIYKIEREMNPDKNYDLSSLNYDHTSKKILQFYSRANIDTKSTLIFGDSLRRPWIWTFDRSFIDERIAFVDEYTIDLLKNLLYLVKPELGDAEIKVLKRLLDLYVGNDKSAELSTLEDNCQTDDDRIYSAADLLEYFCSDPSLKNESAATSISAGEVTKYGVWTSVPDCQDWSTSPIGKLFWE